MAKEIVFTTLESQGKRLLEYSRSLSPLERLAFLQELNKRAYGVHESSSSSGSGEIRVFAKSEDETLEEFLRRVRKEKREYTR